MDENINFLELEGKILDKIKTIYDPEIPINIYDLGLIYEIKVNPDQSVYIKMTVTAPNCPVAETLPNDVHNAVAVIEGISNVTVEVVFDPPWDKNMMSEAAQLELGLL